MPEEPLYEDNLLRVTIAKSPEEHLLSIKNIGKKEADYILPRGCLVDFALTQRGRLESKLNTLNPEIMYDLNERGLTADSVHVAFCQAYAEEELRFHEFQKTQR